MVEPEKYVVVRACSSTYAILCGPFLLLDCVWLGIALQGEKSAWRVVAILSVTLVFTILRGHPKPANEGHLKTGQRE